MDEPVIFLDPQGFPPRIQIPLVRRIFPGLIQNLDLQHVVPEFVKKTVKKPRREVRSIDDAWAS